MNFLHQLQLDQLNPGTSTGVEWIESSGKQIESYSPVDGKIIGSVISTDREAFEHTV